MEAKNKVKPDIILKDFWRDNERFADLFNSYAQTLGRLLDVVKKSAYGVDFVIP